MNLVVNYEGTNISRLNFYNAHELVDSIIVITEYLDGNKIEEQIYNEDYELEYTLTSEYASGERKNIKVYDKDGNLIEQLEN